jgi:hypothetical protein
VKSRKKSAKVNRKGLRKGKQCQVKKDIGKQRKYIHGWLEFLFESASPPSLFPLDDVFLEGTGVSVDDVTGIE